jgi:8-oxo-dGTP pyrophosphatase MutT (NUDIX family)
MGDVAATLRRVERLAGEMESMLTQAGRAWADLADDLAPTWAEVEREIQWKDPTYATTDERAAIQWAQEQVGIDPPEHPERPSAEGDRIVAAAKSSPESTSTLCNGEGECPCRGFVCECDRPMAETIDSLEREGLRNIVGDRPAPASEFEAEVVAHAAVRDAADATWSAPTFIQSEREHPAPPSPAFDPRAATETCAHSGCRRKAFAKLTNIEGDHWLSCAEHYEQDLAAQARADGHEPAWRVPIGPGVVLERWRGGPIGVKVDGELRCYVTAGELARIFEGPVA